MASVMRSRCGADQQTATLSSEAVPMASRFAPNNRQIESIPSARRSRPRGQICRPTRGSSPISDPVPVEAMRHPGLQIDARNGIFLQMARVQNDEFTFVIGRVVDEGQ